MPLSFLCRNPLMPHFIEPRINKNTLSMLLISPPVSIRDTGCKKPGKHWSHFLICPLCARHARNNASVSFHLVYFPCWPFSFLYFIFFILQVLSRLPCAYKSVNPKQFLLLLLTVIFQSNYYP